MPSLFRLPLQIVRAGARLGFEAGRLVVQHVRGGGDEEEQQQPAARPPESEQRAARNGAPTATPPVSPEAAAVATARTEPPYAPGSEPAPEPPAEPEPDHVDTGITEVASFGPEEDAGAQVTVQAPWDDYDALSAQDVITRLRDADDTTKALVLLYERQGKDRRTVVSAAGGS